MVHAYTHWCMLTHSGTYARLAALGPQIMCARVSGKLKDPMAARATPSLATAALVLSLCVLAAWHNAHAICCVASTVCLTVHSCLCAHVRMCARTYMCHVRLYACCTTPISVCVHACAVCACVPAALHPSQCVCMCVCVVYACMSACCTAPTSSRPRPLHQNE